MSCWTPAGAGCLLAPWAVPAEPFDTAGTAHAGAAERLLQGAAFVSGAEAGRTAQLKAKDG